MPRVVWDFKFVNQIIIFKCKNKLYLYELTYKFKCMKKIVSLLLLGFLISGCNDKENDNLDPKPTEPFDVFTLECSSVTNTSAFLEGLALYNSSEFTFSIPPHISFCYSKLPDPDVSDSIVINPMVNQVNNIYADSSEIRAKIEHLDSGITLYYRAFARTKEWIRYGEVRSFTTEIDRFKPIVDSVYNIGHDSAWIAWRFLIFENPHLSRKGVMISLKSTGEDQFNYSYSLADTTTSTLVEDLTPDTEYIARAYGEITGQQMYGNQMLFRTKPVK